MSTPRVITIVVALAILAGFGYWWSKRGANTPNGPALNSGEEVRDASGAGSKADAGGEPAPDSTAQAGAKAEMTKLFEGKRVKGLDWKESSLSQALTYLGTITGIKFAVARDLDPALLDDVEITVALDDISVLDVLNMIVTEPFDLAWEVRENVVTIVRASEGD